MKKTTLTLIVVVVMLMVTGTAHSRNDWLAFGAGAVGGIIAGTVLSNVSPCATSTLFIGANYPYYGAYGVYNPYLYAPIYVPPQQIVVERRVVVERPVYVPVAPAQREVTVRETPAVENDDEVDIWVGPPNGKGPAQFKGRQCFANNVVFPYGARLFNNHGVEVGWIKAGKRLEKNKCIN